MHRPTNTCWGRSMVCLSVDQFEENLLESSGADVKRSKLEERNGIFDVEMDSGIPGPPVAARPDGEMPTAAARGEIPTVPPPAPPPEEHVPEMRGQGVHAKALRIRAFWSEIGRTPGCPACETPSLGKSHTRECKSYQDAWDESRRTASAEQAKRGIGDPDTRPLDPSSSSTDPNPKRPKTTSPTDNENRADRMDEITSEEDQRHLINWNQWTTKTCRRRREWRETFFLFVVRSV